MVCTEHLLAKAECTLSINVLGWQPGASKPGEHGFPTKRRAPKTREHDFPTKRRDFRQNVETHRTSDSSMGSVAL